MGADLASIHSDEENEFVKGLLGVNRSPHHKSIILELELIDGSVKRAVPSILSAYALDHLELLIKLKSELASNICHWLESESFLNWNTGRSGIGTN